MKIILKSLHIENFKGIKLLDIAFSNKTKVKGQNASGKTTVFDAFTWLLFNKNSAGEEKFNVRPLDKDGNRIDNVEIKVVAVLNVDGRNVELSKIQKQNWVKHRGSTAPTLEGNINSFEVDGYPKSEVDYKAYISELVKEDLFKMLTNPQYFVSRPWKEQRDILMKFVSDLPDIELAMQLNIVNGEDTHQYDSLITEMQKAPSTDDIRNKFTKALSEWKKKQQEIPVRIDELSKSLVQVDTSEQELAKVDLERKIADVDSKIANAGDAVGDLMQQEMKLQFELSGIMQTMNQELSKRKSSVEGLILDCNMEVKRIETIISANEKMIIENKATIESAEKKRSELGEQYKSEAAKVFDETPYLFREEEWQFDENSTICKSCGQTLPADRIEQIKADFEKRKATAKTNAEKSLADAKERFTAQHNATIEHIKSEGFKQKDTITTLTAENEELQREIDSLKNQDQEVTVKKQELERELATIPTEADYSTNVEFVSLKAKHDEVKEQIESLKAGSNAADTFKEERNALVAELDSVKAVIAKASKNVEIEERIEALEEEQKDVAQKVADVEKMLYLLEQFIRAKMLRISDTINQHFAMVRFLLFKELLNGGLSETCECMYLGVPYSTLNTAARIQCGLDIIRSLSKLYEVNCPVFIDNRESCTDIPEMDCQVISLYVDANCKELVVETE